MMRALPLVALALLSACASDPTPSGPPADAGAEASDGAPVALEGSYVGGMSFRGSGLSPADPVPNGGTSSALAPLTDVTAGVLSLNPFLARCAVRLLPQSPTLAQVEAATCESDPRDSWQGKYSAARLVLRPGTTLTIGGGRISGALVWDFTGTIDRMQPNAGMTQRGVITLNLNLTRAP